MNHHLLAIMSAQAARYSELTLGERNCTVTLNGALSESKLPARPDYDAASRFLIKARREMANH
jgi:hypothetical protein